ncbi:hypothetical protein DFJ63DRAFT_252670 [Scheffersomyces coipomensis]|uniref:uncharacterized protein n=1 Tax=Scheffersomyces coipomensis TaxID=1788519 RepID=UPI00315DFE44
MSDQIDLDENVCSFCLGGDTDIPPFGNLDDAKSFIKPCSTCSLKAHSKCLLDWFNSLPADKLQIIDADSIKEFDAAVNQSSSHNHSPTTNDNNDNDDNTFSSNTASTTMPGSFFEDDAIPNSSSPTNIGEIGMGQPPINNNDLHINLSSHTLGQWLGNLSFRMNFSDTRNTPINDNNDGSGSPATLTAISDSHNQRSTRISRLTESFPRSPINNVDGSGSPSKEIDGTYVAFLIASCPQCKQDIIFSMNRSSFLALTNATKNAIIRSVQYGAIFLGFTSAITGIVSMGYIGLTTCGLKMIDCIIPGPLLVRMLTKPSINASTTSASLSSLSQLLLGNPDSYAIDNLEQALVKGLIDPLKFSRIPVLPIVLYRLRSSSLLNCILDKKSNDSFNNWFTELMLTGYISSLGNHELIRSLIKNNHSILLKISSNPLQFYKYLTIEQIFKGIDFLKANNLISLLIPARWIYDALFRLTINRLYFNIAMKIRPRDIANSLSQDEVDNLEIINNDLNNYKLNYSRLLTQANKKYDIDNQSIKKIPVISSVYKYLFIRLRLFKFGSVINHAKCQIISSYYNTIACFKSDYSSTLLHKSFTIRLLTTLVWPYASSKIGSLIFHFILKKYKFDKNGTLSSDKLMLISNLMGIISMVIVKDLFNLFLCWKKASQISKMALLTIDKSSSVSSSTIINQDNETDIEEDLGF